MIRFLSAITLASVLLLVGCNDSKPPVESPAEKAQDEKIQELTKRIEALEQKPVEHHYELRNEGMRTFRFDPSTGNSCISLTSKADWKNPDTIRQGCQYQYFVDTPARPGEDIMTRTNVAECLFVGKCNPPK
jgi:hypothetical protein